MKSKYFASNDIYKKMKKHKQKKVEVYSFFPCDRSDCECKPLVKNVKDRLAKMNQKERDSFMEDEGHIECPRDKSGMKRYKLTCNNCNVTLGYVWASDSSLNDWCDFHYYQYTDGEFWYGCITPNISPIDSSLGIECSCGADSRDFRANMTLPYKTALKIEDKNKKGRQFGQKDSKFKAVRVNLNKLPEIKEVLKWQK